MVRIVTGLEHIGEPVERPYPSQSPISRIEVLPEKATIVRFKKGISCCDITSYARNRCDNGIGLFEEIEARATKSKPLIINFEGVHNSQLAESIVLPTLTRLLDKGYGRHNPQSSVLGTIDLVGIRIPRYGILQGHRFYHHKNEELARQMLRV